MTITVAFAAKPVPPRVHYRLTILDADSTLFPNYSIWANDINESGTVVGTALELVQMNPYPGYEDRGAFMYSAGVMLDLNQLGGTWTDMETNSDVTGLWIAAAASKVNNFHQIVGKAYDQNAEQRVYLLEFPLDWPTLPATFKLLPRAGGPADVNRKGAGINDAGVVLSTIGDGVGVYADTVVYTPSSNYAPQLLGVNSDTVACINNYGVVATRKGNIVTPVGYNDYSSWSVINIAGRDFFGINNLGNICGIRPSIRSKGKIVQQGGVIRLDFPYAPVNEKWLGTGNAHGINDQNHVLFTNGFLNTDEYGTFPLENLVVFDTPQDATYWQNNVRTAFALNNGSFINLAGIQFGEICGRVGTRAFVLTPEP